jgi:alpha-tubulin suppressor-like RCC1 family protein
LVGNQTNGPNPKLVACGGDFTVVYSDETSGFYSMGSNSIGQLGDGTTSAQVPRRLSPNLIPNLNISGTTTLTDSNGNKYTVPKTVTQMEGSLGQFVVILLNDNTIYTWGLDFNGRLGKGTPGSYTAQSKT